MEEENHRLKSAGLLVGDMIWDSSQEGILFPSRDFIGVCFIFCYGPRSRRIREGGCFFVLMVFGEDFTVGFFKPKKLRGRGPTKQTYIQRRLLKKKNWCHFFWSMGSKKSSKSIVDVLPQQTGNAVESCSALFLCFF